MSIKEKYISKANFSYIWSIILDMFVKKEDGKSLSSNDFSNEDKDKLSTVERGANRTMIENSFSSISTVNALSANKGRELNDKIEELSGLVGVDEVYVLTENESESDIPEDTVLAIFPSEEAEEIDWTNFYTKPEIDEIIIRADFKRGKSAYEVAVELGFEGSEEDWLSTLKGEPFTYEDFTAEQLAILKGEPFEFDDFTEEQLALLKGEKGESFEYEDFTEEQLALLKGEKGEPFEFDDFTEEQLALLKGEKGEPFTYEDFTAEQLAILKGEPFEFDDFTEEQLALLKGEKGEPFEFDDFTEEQLALLKGEKGEPFTYEDFTAEQLALLKGEKGEPFEFDDFTEEQLMIIKGEKGEPFEFEDFTEEQLGALTPKRGRDYWTESDVSAIQNYVDYLISELVDSAPETLDTLWELANSLGNDPNFATTVLSKIGEKLDKTTFNDLATVAHTGQYSDLSGLPTKLSQFTNDQEFMTKTEVQAMFTQFATDYLGGYKVRVANDSGKTGYITINKG